MKKTIISLFLITSIIYSTFIGVYASHDTDPHVASTGIIVLYTHDTNPH